MELKSPFFTVNIDPGRANFSIRPINSRLPRIEVGRLNATYRSGEDRFDLIGRPWKVNREFGEKITLPEHGPAEKAEFWLSADENGIAVKVVFALPKNYPLVLWKLIFENAGAKTVLFDRADLLIIDPLKESRLLVGAGGPTDLSFFSNGWQSWSVSGAYGANEPMHQTRLIGIQDKQCNSETTPAPRRAGEYASDFFGVIASRRHRVGFLAGFLAQKLQFGTLTASFKGETAAHLFANMDGIDFNPGMSIETDWAVVSAFELDEKDPLGCYLDAVGRENHARVPEKTPVGWCSWYEFYTNISHEKISSNLKEIQKVQPELPVEVVQIDDGFERAVGDWLLFKPEFPDGVAPLAEDIKKAGYIPGLWLAPFIVHPDSLLYKQHPEMLLRQKNKRLVNSGFNWNKFTTSLDMTHPAAQEYIREVISTAVEKWGYPYLKLDFLYAAAQQGKHHDPTLTRAQVLRKGLELIRKAAGPETFILGCGLPLGTGIGLVDGMRIGADVSGEWIFSFNGIKLIFDKEPNTPSAKNAMQNTITRSAMHRRWWINDPDCLLVREKMKLNLDEVHTLATTIGLSAGMLLLSDNMVTVSPDRLKIAQSLIPVLRDPPQVIDLFDNHTPHLLRQDLESAAGKWHLLGWINWKETPVSMTFRPEEFHLPKGSYYVRSYWDQKSYIAGTDYPALEFNVPKHGCLLLAVRQSKHDQAQFLGSDLHFSQGIEVKEWKDTGKEVEIALELPRKTSGIIEISLVGHPRRIEVNGVKVVWREISEGVFQIPVEVDLKARIKIFLEGILA